MNVGILDLTTKEEKQMRQAGKTVEEVQGSGQRGGQAGI
jgi:hypothetical protein